MSASFSEIPVDLLSRLATRHGKWGVGFRRSFIVSRGGARVWYLDKGTPVADTLFARVGDLLGRQDFNDDLWKLLPFIDPVYSDGRYEFDWEREWRVPGGLTFTLNEIAFLIRPQGQQGADLEFIENRNVTAPVFASDDGGASFEDALEYLGTQIDKMAAEFLRAFEDPIECLPVDEGEYVWLVDEWETEDAVGHLFENLNESVSEELVTYLNGISGSWVNVQEWNDFCSGR